MANRDGSTVERDPATLPKAHLHLHLTGSMRPSTLAELATRYGVTVDDSDQTGDWRDFQRRYDAARSTIRTVEDLHRVILEAAQDDVRDGSVWLELQASPTGIAHQLNTGLEETIELLLAGCHRARRATGLGIGLIVAASWTRPPAEAERIAAAAARYTDDGVVGFGISNDERGTDPADYRDAFTTARRAGLAVTPHSGFYTAGDHIRACVEHGADRIGHGVTAAGDPRLMAELARRQITLEVCPTSYPPFGVVADLPTLRDHAVPVALGADDPLLFGSSLADQYRIARDTLGLTDADLAELARASIRACAAPDQATRLSQVDAWLQ
jgi:adenosine deaminase